MWRTVKYIFIILIVLFLLIKISKAQDTTNFWDGYSTNPTNIKEGYLPDETLKKMSTYKDTVPVDIIKDLKELKKATKDLYKIVTSKEFKQIYQNQITSFGEGVGYVYRDGKKFFYVTADAFKKGFIKNK